MPLRFPRDVPSRVAHHPPAADAPSPQQCGDWHCDTQLHSGELAEIVVARPAAASPATPCNYVLKRLHRQWENEPRALELFAREAEVAGRIRHPHLVTVLDAQLHRAPYFLVMPRLAGVPLSRILARGQRIELSNALWYARQTAQALGTLHAHGWLHTDVKPANILVAPSGHTTLIDLGFARPLAEDPGAASDRWVAGTIQYMAPEMLVGDERPTTSSDWYSLGATLYEMLVGTPPFAHLDPAELARRHREDPPRPLRSLVPDLPEPVVALVHRMLSKQPIRRPQAADEVVKELVALEIRMLPEQVLAAG